MADLAFRTRRERALRRAARARRRAACALALLILLACGLVAAWRLGLPWAPAAVDLGRCRSLRGGVLGLARGGLGG